MVRLGYFSASAQQKSGSIRLNYFTAQLLRLWLWLTGLAGHSDGCRGLLCRPFGPHWVVCVMTSQLCLQKVAKLNNNDGALTTAGCRHILFSLLFLFLSPCLLPWQHYGRTGKLLSWNFQNRRAKALRSCCQIRQVAAPCSGGRAQDEFWCDWHIVSASLVRDHNVIQLSCKSSQHSAWFWIAVKRQWLLDHPTRTLPTLIGPEIDRSARDVIESLGRDGAAR